jgi:Kdo2-lipid IVA lauroyltransferase/acyltransferase
MQLIRQKLFFILIRSLTKPFGYLPYPILRFCGRFLGLLGFYILTEFRKNALSNLFLAQDLPFSDKEKIDIAKGSFQNLAINCLEYSKLEKEKHLDKTIRCVNPEKAEEIYSKNNGIIFFCGHQSNWEVLFLDGTRRMKGAAIGKRFKNPYLTHWIFNIRQRFKGIIVDPKKAFVKGLKLLKQGYFFGVVGDQGMPDSGYSFPFLGRKAWFSPLPALFAIKTGSPIIVATTKRTHFGYEIFYHDPIWPDTKANIKEETKRLMDLALLQFEQSVKESPKEWFWQHNFYKQQTPEVIFRPYRKETLLIILPEDETLFFETVKALHAFKQLYPNEFIFLLIPKKKKNVPLAIKPEKIYYYQTTEEMKLADYRFKLVFNFSEKKNLKSHYLNLSAFDVLNRKKLLHLAAPYLPSSFTLSDVLLRALSREGTLWQKEVHAS